MKYFVYYTDLDGRGCFVEFQNKESLKLAMNAEFHDEYPDYPKSHIEHPLKGRKYTIIKGEKVKVIEKRVVKEFDIE